MSTRTTSSSPTSRSGPTSRSRADASNGLPPRPWTPSPPPKSSSRRRSAPKTSRPTGPRWPPNFGHRPKRYGNRPTRKTRTGAWKSSTSTRTPPTGGEAHAVQGHAGDPPCVRDASPAGRRRRHDRHRDRAALRPQRRRVGRRDDAHQPPDPEPVWFGPVRLQRQSAAERPVWIGDRQVIIRTYLVAFPHGVPEFRINDEVRFGGTDDAELPDQRLWMHDVWFGSELWQRDTVCQNAPRTQR